MCGRYFLEASADKLMAVFGEMPMPALAPRYNIAPTQPVPIVRQADNARREMVLVRWGLVPGWSKGPDSRYSMINARVETVATKPAYRSAFRYRRCLIPADGFYEWKASADGKQPYVLRARDRQPLALAGLWEHWQDDQGNELETCVILVRSADQQTSTVHDRMPVIVTPASFDAWLDLRIQKPQPVETLLAAQQPPELSIYPVSRDVNSPRNDRAALLDPLPETD
jgi:putative SOS response-associated peptidase YedK